MRVAVTILLLTFFIQVHSQEVKEGYVPILNGHNFVDAASRVSPFTKTTMGITTGIASTEDIVFPISLGRDTTLLGIDGNVLFVQGGFFYQQRIKKWLAVYMNLDFALRTGNDVPTLSLEGISTLASFELGWKFKLIRSNSFMLSGTFNITNNEAVFVNVGKWIAGIRNNQQTVTISQKVPALYSSAGLNASWALTPMFALNGSVIGGFGESLSRGETTFNHVSEISVEADLLARTKVPLGFKLTYISSSTPRFLWGESGTANTVDLIIAYTQSTDFRISVESYLSRTPFDDLDGSASFGGLAINLQYYFN